MSTYIGCNLDKDTRAAKRKLGYINALQSEGLTFLNEATAPGLSSVEAGRHLTSTLLNERPELDCILYSNDDLAMGGLGYCIDAGVDVPRSIAVCGFNGLELLKAFPSKIATSITARQEIGAEAARIILAALEAEGATAPVQRIIEPIVSLGSLDK